MPAQMEPQEAIDRGLKKPSECDIVIVIFWARMGTPLSNKYLKEDGSRCRSGTEYEFLDGLDAAHKTGKPDVFVYRRKEPPALSLRDPELKEKERQWELVEEFFREFRNPDGSFKRFYQEYDQPSDFEALLNNDLRDRITIYLESYYLDKAENAPQKNIRLFLSYAHEDEVLRFELQKHLKPLQRAGLIAAWSDRQIEAGDDWKEQIDENLERANIILLLVSADFIASDYCYDKEMGRALERHKSGEATVIPVIVRDVNWKRTPFATLQVLPENGTPVMQWPNRDSAWRNVSEAIERLIEKILKKR